jgi:hypothetical protein
MEARRTLTTEGRGDADDQQAASAPTEPPPIPRDDGRLGRAERTAALLGVLGVLGVFAVALMLEPDPRGLGTHERLGLAPCSTQYLLDVPCPFCGMTTAFSHMVRGQVVRGFLVQPAGAALFALFAAAGILLLVMAVRGKAPGRRLQSLMTRWSWRVLIPILAAAWLYKLVTYKS